MGKYRLKWDMYPVAGDPWEIAKAAYKALSQCADWLIQELDIRIKFQDYDFDNHCFIVIFDDRMLHSVIEESKYYQCSVTFLGKG